MKNAIILHGGPSREEYYDHGKPSMSNAHWLPWLQGQLLKHDIAAATPEVPNAFDRIWEVWKKEVERFDIGADSILIGHSTGAGFFIKYLSLRHDLRVDKLILVAPWLDPYGTLETDFFRNFTIDSGLCRRTHGMTLISSDNDQPDIMQTVRIIRDKIPDISYREFRNHGHFTIEDMNTPEFPELLKIVLE